MVTLQRQSSDADSAVRTIHRLSSIVIAGLVAGASGAPAAARPAPAWTPPRSVSPLDWPAQDSPTVAVDRRGDAVVAWIACEMRVSGCYPRVQARALTRRGMLSPILNLSELGMVPESPQVAIDDHGNGTVVWGDASATITARRVSRHGAVGPLRTLTPVRAGAESPGVAVAPDGRALVAWAEYHLGTWSIEARRILADGRLRPRLEMGAADGDAPSVAMDRRGTGLVAWAVGRRVLARRLHTRGVSRARVIASARTPFKALDGARVAASQSGEFTISYRSVVPTLDTPQGAVWVRRWHRDGSLGRPRRMSPPTHFAFPSHALATSRNGDVAVWTRQRPGKPTLIYGRCVTPTGARGHLVRLGAGDRPDAALGDDGNGVAVWQRSVDAAKPVAVSAITRGCRFAAARTIGRDGRAPRVTASPAGRLIVTWQQHVFPYRIQIAVRR